jgi:hypothetical protein
MHCTALFRKKCAKIPTLFKKSAQKSLRFLGKSAQKFLHFLKRTSRLPFGQSLGRVGADAHKVPKNPYAF